MSEILLSPGRDSIHSQIYRRLRDMIELGQLKAGQRVSSLRTMAVELGVARGTVQVAYDRLLGEGYLVARGPAGTFVADGAASRQRTRQTLQTPPKLPLLPKPPASAAGQRPRWSASPQTHSDVQIESGGAAPALFQLGLPALDEFPRKLWTRLMARQVRMAHALTKPAPAGYGPLRAALTSYLHGSRGIASEPAQLFVVPSYQAGLELTVNALGLIERTGSIRDRKAWVETPGYPPTSQVLRHLGLSPCFVPVDEHGLDVDKARKAWPDAKMAVVTPSHQSPTGVALSLPRRMSLLAWAAENDGWIVEDDYDGEFRYRGHPLPALKSLDASDRVIYCGTLSKVMYPGLRLAYLVVPTGLVSAFEIAAQRSTHGGCPDLMQATVAEFIIDGHFSRHIRRMRALYANRRSFLSEALKQYEHLGFTVRLQDGGMHLLLDVPAGSDDMAMAHHARQAGFGIHALSSWRGSAAGQRALMLGFTNVGSALDADRHVKQLMDVLELLSLASPSS